MALSARTQAMSLIKINGEVQWRVRGCGCGMTRAKAMKTLERVFPVASPLQKWEWCVSLAATPPAANAVGPLKGCPRATNNGLKNATPHKSGQG